MKHEICRRKKLKLNAGVNTINPNLITSKGKKHLLLLNFKCPWASGRYFFIPKKVINSGLQLLRLNRIPYIISKKLYLSTSFYFFLNRKVIAFLYFFNVIT